MEGSQIHIGESGKVKSILEMLDLAKILSLIVGIVALLLAAWYGFIWSFFSAGYWIVAAVINLIAHTKMDEYTSMVKSREYSRAKDEIMMWMILTIIFGFLTGVFLLIAYIYLDELPKETAPVPSPEQPGQPPSELPPPP